jgi:hypothetical protein
LLSFILHKGQKFFFKNNTFVTNSLMQLDELIPNITLVFPKNVSVVGKLTIPAQKGQFWGDL